MRNFTKALLMGFLCLGVCPLESAIYSYRDERGHLFLTDNPPNNKYQIVVTTRKEREGPNVPNAGGNVQPFEGMTPQKVIMPNDEAFSSYINEAAQKCSIDPYLIKAVIKVESDFDPSVRSSKGACGLMQLIPSTAKIVKVSDIFDPRENILGGARYLRMMLDRFGGKQDFALAGYNAGPNRVEQCGGIPAIRETRNYVKKVNHYYRLFRNGAGLSEKVVRAPKAIPLVPSLLSQKLSAAYSLYRRDDIEGSIRMYQDILNVFPRSSQALYNLACLLDSERRYDEAIEAYQKALREDPFLDKAIYNLSIIYERLGQHSDAIASWKKFILATRDEEKIILAERYVKELKEYAALNQ